MADDDPPAERTREEADEAAAPSPSPKKHKRARRVVSPIETEPSRFVQVQTSRPADGTIRKLVLGAAGCAIVGIALVGTQTSTPGVVLVVSGVLGLIAAIHRFGRLGPDAGPFAKPRKSRAADPGDRGRSHPATDDD